MICLSNFYRNIQLAFYRLFELSRGVINYIRWSSRERQRLVSLSHAFPVGGERLTQDLQSSIVFFTATIGEFNGIKHLIFLLAKEMPDSKIVIVCGQDQYIEPIAAISDSWIVGSHLSPWTSKKLFSIAKPDLVVIAEGPCLFARFPIPLTQSLFYQALRNDCPTVVLNAAMHPINLQSKLDRLEYRLFSNIQRQSITKWLVANEYFANLLIDEKIPKDKIDVIGDIKIDLVFSSTLPQPPSQLLQILKGLAVNSDPIIVAGSVNKIDEYEALLDAWELLLPDFPNLRLIIAPRHIQRPEAMEPLISLLEKRGHCFLKRSEIVDLFTIPSIFVIDVFGELPYYYDIAACAYIGRNHGLLEPLRFKKPVVVGPNWVENYVTFDQYQSMIDSGAVICASHGSELNETLSQLLKDDCYYKSAVSTSLEYCEVNMGATDRCLSNLLQYTQA